MVRVFAVTIRAEATLVMPGGLTRISTSLDSMVVSMQRGGGSKDTWVLGDGPAPPFTLLRPATHPLEVSRATFDLPSRVADNLFWLGRYTERVEASVRITRAILARVSRKRTRARAAGLNAGLEILTALGYIAGERTVRRAEKRSARDDVRSGRVQWPGLEHSSGARAWRGCCAIAFRWTRG